MHPTAPLPRTPIGGALEAMPSKLSIAESAEFESSVVCSVTDPSHAWLRSGFFQWFFHFDIGYMYQYRSPSLKIGELGART